jgi:tetratricopeptide (TPR) repeat protein
LSSEPDVEAKVALALARTGAGAEAAKLADKLNGELPLGTMMQNYTLPTIWAAIELQKNNPRKAIDILETTRPYERGQESLDYLYPVYVRGESFLALGEAEKAATEFEKIIAHRGIVENFVFGALVHLQMARAKAMGGDTGAARKFYNEYFALWKDADQAIPIFKRAQGEYSRLR